MIPKATAAYHQSHSRLLLALLFAVGQAWSRLNRDGSWEDQYKTDVGPRILALLLAAQTTATRDADAYVAAVLNELAVGPKTDAGVVPATAFLGLAGDGRAAQTLLASSVGRARASLARQRETVFPEVDAPGSLLTVPELRVTRPDSPAMRQKGLDDGAAFLRLVVATILADTARATESAAMVQRPWVTGYYRMLAPPSCSRCVILAGRFYKWNAGFDRHPRCDCIHIPAAEADHADIRLNPSTYFDSLTTAEQDKVFTITGAKAIRAGADIGQVVNSRRGMQTAQVGGRDVLVSTEGTTKSGLASRVRTGRNQAARLMPESIYAVATDRDDAIRLLRLNGFIL